MVTCLLITSKITSSHETSNSTEHPKAYQFSYTVNNEENGDFKTHQETNDGKQVRGMYSVGEPNGDLRVVTYTADSAHGFQAVVQVHPAGSPASLTSSEHKLYSSGNSHNKTNANIENDFRVVIPPPSSNETANENHSQIMQRLSEENKEKSKLEFRNITTESNHDTPESMSQPTNEDGKEIMTLLKELPPATNKQVPKIEYIFEDDQEEGFVGDPTLYRNSQDNPSEGPQIIPVKIQEDPLVIKTDVEPESNIDMSTYSPILSSDDDIVTMTYEGNQNEQITFDYSNVQISNENKQQVHPPQNTDDKELNKSSVSKESSSSILNSKLQEHINSNNSNNIQNSSDQQNASTDISPTEDYKSSEDYTTTEIINNLKIEIPNHKFIELSNTFSSNKFSIQDNLGKQQTVTVKTDHIEKVNSTSNSNSSNSSSSGKTPNSKLRDSVMLAALVNPHPTLLQFSCLPETTEKQIVKTVPTVPSIMPVATVTNQHQNIQQHRLVLTTGIPFYPLQIINYNPVQNPESSPGTKIKFSSQIPVFSLGAQAPGVVTSFTDESKTTIPTQITHSNVLVPGNKLMMQSPQQPLPLSTYTRVRDEGTLPNSHYPHHLIPFPWIHPNPHRSNHITHNKRFPIFVLPMSHNFNFAPTFDPAMPDNHNH
ncbi:hypothetical protein J6590_046503 [Homalodisca vitripennis]|nr:hypothetical protein J6590_046503 [Homalodisca vitripennis]